MSRDIDALVAALQRDHPTITVQQARPTETDADDAGRWVVHHPEGFVDVQVVSASGNLPFQVESELAPPTRAPSIDKAMKLVVQRLGLPLLPPRA